MPKTITWLHISDLHAGKPGSWDAARVIEKLVEDVKKMEDEHDLHPDFIFFTGDAAFGQDISCSEDMLSDQFAKAQDFISAVRQAFSPEIPLTNLFLVPGNHDVNRKKATPEQISWLDTQEDPRIINDLIHKGDIQWQRYMERLTAYSEFLKTNGYSHLLEDAYRLVYTATQPVAGINVGIGGFNTAWSCCHDEERGKLWMGSQWQLDRMHARLMQADVSIALMHHPHNWLNRHEDKDFGRGLEHDFKFILHGHEHSDWVTTGTSGYTHIAAGACYERADKENGYNFVRLDLKTRQGEVWLRKYDHKGDGWIPLIVRDKTDDHGRWPLTHLSWLSSLPISATTPQPLVGDEVPQEVIELGMEEMERFMERGGILSRREWFDSFEIPESLSFKTFLIIRPQAPAEIAPPREDITWQIIESKLEYQLPSNEKKPLLQELRTEEQIANHFLPLPKFTDRLDEWLAAERDLLFLGLPFCGKTTLLTYLALEVSRREKLLPIYLKPREDLTIEESEAAVARLKASLKQIGLSHPKQQIILILDNVHTPLSLKIAHLLLKAPRPWRLWAAARFRELEDCISARLENPWDEKDYVRDACDLVGKKEIEFAVDKVIAPILAGRGEEKLVEQVCQVMEEAGQVPVRYLAQVWKRIAENLADVESGYGPMIKDVPKGVEAIVRDVMPRNRPGMDALTIADYLKKPSWDLLTYVLSVVEEYGSQVAQNTIYDLRHSFALLSDSEQPDRATMYDPVRESVKAHCNLTVSLRKQIWSGLETFLEQEDSIKEEGMPDDLADAWVDLSDLAIDEEKYSTALSCAQRANVYATSKYKIGTLFQIAYCLHEKPQPDWEAALDHYHQALALLSAPEQAAERASTLYQIAWCMHEKPQPDWDEAIVYYRQALDFLNTPEQAAERASTLRQIAYCLRNKPQPDWDAALEAYRQVLELRSAPEQAAERARTLHQIAYCLRSKPQPDWEAALDHYHQALELRSAPEQAADRASTLRQIAYCLRNKPQPDWDAALEACRQALELLSAPEQAAERAITLFGIAWCLHEKPQPEWDAALEACRQALELLSAPEQAAERAITLYQIAWCLHEKPQPEWEAALEAYRQALELRSAPEQAAGRASTLHQIAWCLHEKPQPDWDEAIVYYRQALDFLNTPEQAAERASTLRQIAYCLRNKPQPDWDAALEALRQALELRSAPEQAAERASTLYQIAYCLHNKPQPDWDAALEAYRQALDLRSALEQAAERASTLHQIAWCLHKKPQPDWEAALEAYRQALELRSAPEQAADRASTLYQIAWCLHEKPQPEWDEAIVYYRQALDLLAVQGQTTAQVAALHPRYTISLITALDNKGLYEEADAWAGMLKGTSFVEGDVTPGDEPLINRRQAYLALRSNDLDTALSLTQALRDTAEHTYAMLLASIAYFAADRLKKARQAITTANPTQADVAWIRAIAIGWFNRYDPVKREEYLALLPG